MWGKERNCGIGTGPVSKRLELGGRDRNWGGRDRNCWKETRAVWVEGTFKGTVYTENFDFLIDKLYLGPI